jgi:hypothetical protein
MKTIYIDTEFKCHIVDDGTMTAVQTDFFDGKCDEYVEGYRFIPEGAVWVRPDGAVFQGEMIAAWRPFEELERAQVAHERQLLAEYAEALRTVGVTV